MIILNLGGETSAAKAYSLDTGKEIWSSEIAGKGVYLSPEILTILNEEHLIIALEGKIASLNPPMERRFGQSPGKFS